MRIADLKMMELLFSKKEYEAEKSVRDFLPIYIVVAEKKTLMSVKIYSKKKEPVAFRLKKERIKI